MLSLYVDHWSPMNAVENNSLTKTLQNIGKSLKTKTLKRVIIFSAHFLRNENIVEISTEAHPHMIYDMVGFPEALYTMKYDVRTDQEGAETLGKILEENSIQNVFNKHRWIDHGVWSTLSHIFPAADIPVIVVSTSMSWGGKFALQIGEILAEKYDDATLLICSGNIVHNFQMLEFGRTTPFSWAKEFDTRVAEYLQNRDRESLKNAHDIVWWVFSVPTLDHYLPFLTFVGLLDTRTVRSLHEGFAMGSISERIYTNF